MNNFTHKPELRLNNISQCSKRLHEIKVKHVRSIKPYSVHIKLRYPESYYIKDIVLHLGIALIEFHKQIISAPVII